MFTLYMLRPTLDKATLDVKSIGQKQTHSIRLAESTSVRIRKVNVTILSS